jgi:hypothetical protein
MLREPIGVKSFFTYEQTGQPPLSTEILDQNAKSYANQGPAIIAAEKVTLPSNFGTDYPSWGSQAAINSIQNLPSLVQTVQNAPILAAQRQVELSKASQNLLELKGVSCAISLRISLRVLLANCLRFLSTGESLKIEPGGWVLLYS